VEKLQGKSRVIVDDNLIDMGIPIAMSFSIPELVQNYIT